MPRSGAAVPVDPDQVDIAMTYLWDVKPTKRPTAFSDEVAGEISLRARQEISNGATIAACVALGPTFARGTESACLRLMRC
jgi:hypothetical protein